MEAMESQTPENHCDLYFSVFSWKKKVLSVEMMIRACREKMHLTSRTWENTLKAPLLCSYKCKGCPLVEIRGFLCSSFSFQPLISVF